MALQLPYVSACCQANHYYKLFISWTNQNIRNTFVQRNMFDFKHIKVIPSTSLCLEVERLSSLLSHLTGRTSTTLDQWWCLPLQACCMLDCLSRSLRNGQRMRRIWYISHSPYHLLLHVVYVGLQLIMPGYCVAGTVGHKVLSGAKKIEIDKKMVNVRLSVQYMSFRSGSSATIEWCMATSSGDVSPPPPPPLSLSSAHADAKGIMQLIRQVPSTSSIEAIQRTTLHSQAAPSHVMLVHGEAAKMDFLRQKVMQEFGVHCYMPANGEMVTIATKPVIAVDASRTLLKRAREQLHG